MHYSNYNMENYKMEVPPHINYLSPDSLCNSLNIENNESISY